MGSKFIIFVVFATVVRGSLGAYSSIDDGPLNDINNVQYGLQSFYAGGTAGWNRAVSGIYTQIKIYMTNIFFGVNCTINPLVLEVNKNNTVAGAVAALQSTLLGALLVRSDGLSEIQISQPRIYTLVWSFAELFFTAIDLVVGSKNTTSTLATLEAMEANADIAIPTVTETLYNGIRGSNVTFPPMVEMAYEDAEKQTNSIFAIAVHNIFNMIKVLLATISVGQQADEKAAFLALEGFRNASISGLNDGIARVFLFMKSLSVSDAILQAEMSAGASQNPDLQKETLSEYSKTINSIWKKLESVPKNRDDVNICGNKTEGPTFADIQKAVRAKTSAT